MRASGSAGPSAGAGGRCADRAELVSAPDKPADGNGRAERPGGPDGDPDGRAAAGPGAAADERPAGEGWSSSSPGESGPDAGPDAVPPGPGGEPVPAAWRVASDASTARDAAMAMGVGTSRATGADGAVSGLASDWSRAGSRCRDASASP